MKSWKDPYGEIIKQEREERDYREGYQDGDYSKRGQTCSMRSSNVTKSYIAGFKEASGYTPDEWKRM